VVVKTQKRVKKSRTEPVYVQTIEGRDLYFMLIRPYGEGFTEDRIYFFKDSNIVSTEQADGKHFKSVIIDGSPYKRQDVPNE
jgi:hypothetical protein